MELFHGDCLEIMKELKDNSIDLILTDLPYGTTRCKWDSIIPLENLWEQYQRLLKNPGAVVLTSSQPFTSVLVMSNPNWFKHEWIWIKNRGSNFANTVREPMKEHESVLVFSPGKWIYNKQMQERSGGGKSRVNYKFKFNTHTDNYGSFQGLENRELPNLRVPSSWQKFNCEVGLHPTQKPVTLFEYLIKTYSNEGDTILDSCMGSGTTGVACANLNRKFIGIEKEEKYFKVTQDRLKEKYE